MSLVKRTLAVLLLCLPLTLLSGCWDSEELSDMFIVTGIALDAIPGSEDINIALQIGRISPGASGGGSSGGETFILEEQSSSIYAGIETLQRNSARFLFLKQNQVVIIGSELAKKGLLPILDAFVREYSTRMEVWVIITEGKAKDLLSTELDAGQISGLAIGNLISKQSIGSEALGAQMIDLCSSLIARSSAMTIPIIAAEPKSGKDDKKKTLASSGVAILKDDKMIGQFDLMETSGYVWSKGPVRYALLDVITDHGHAAFLCSSGNSTSEPIFYSDGTIGMKLRIRADFAVIEIQGYLDETSTTLDKRLIEDIEAEIESQVRKTFEKAQSFSADIYDLGININRNHHREWIKIEDQWIDIFSKAKLVIDIDVKIVDGGRLTLPIEKEGERKNAEKNW